MAPGDQPTAGLIDLANIPSDIIARIFNAGTMTWREECDPDDRVPFPWLVCGVCQSWKFLALNTPELWSFVIPPLHRFKTKQSSEDWTSQWLLRSGALEVSVVIDDRLRTRGNYTVQESQAVILGVLRGIGRHAHRLRRLDIWSQHVYPNDLNTLFQHAEEPMRLRQLSLCCGRITQTQILPNSSTHTAVMFSWFERLPRLHKLRLAGAVFPVVSPLTSLSVHGLCARYSEVQTIFATCPNVKSLILPGLLPMALPLPSPTLPITAPSLRSIAVSFKRVPHLDLLYPVSVLDMPNLEYLEVDGDLDISRAFDSLSASSKIQKVRLSNWPKGLSRKDQALLRSFNGLRCLQLLETSTDGLLVDTSASPSMGRKNSISSLLSFSSSSSSSARTPHECWPLLTDITLSTIIAEDVMRLCRYVNQHRSVQTIRLSENARWHLSESLLRDEDTIQLKGPSGRRRGPGINDVEEWLNKLADVGVFKTSPGLLNREHCFPLQEL